MEKLEEQVDYLFDSSEGDTIFYSCFRPAVSIAPGGGFCRSGSPLGLTGDGCRNVNPHGHVGVWVGGSVSPTAAIMQPVHFSSGGLADGLVFGASVCVGSGSFGSPNVDFPGPGAVSLSFPFSSVSFFSSSGPPSPLFLSEEVHSILKDFCSEPLSLAAAEAFLADLSSPRGFLSDFSSSSQGGGSRDGVLTPG